MLLSELYVKCVYLNLSDGGGAKFMKNFRGGGENYNSFGTSAL
jgi:hypothetical protein